MLRIDGSEGEGGGQILRTALGLSLATGQAVELVKVRAGRSRPGLLRQHLACVRAATSIGRARVTGDTIGSTSLRFEPTGLVGGPHHVDVGSAGSTLLVVQAVLPGLLSGTEPSTLEIEGGTHNPAAPPFPFVALAFVPVLRRMGFDVDIELVRPGFYPAGGGFVRLRVTPGRGRPVEVLERGPVVWSATAMVSGVAAGIGHRELRVLGDALHIPEERLHLVDVERPRGPGNAVWAEALAPGGVSLFSGFGERGVRAEEVATSVLRAARTWLSADVPVDQHLADQLLVPFALAGGGSLRTTTPTSHTLTNQGVIERFLPVVHHNRDEGGGRFRIDVATRK